jgi:hypothetical protein
MRFENPSAILMDAAEAQFACGQVDAALAHSQGAGALARRFGAASSLGRALHVHDRLARDESRRARLGRAAGVLSEYQRTSARAGEGVPYGQVGRASGSRPGRKGGTACR